MLEIVVWGLLFAAAIPILMCWTTLSAKARRMSVAMLTLLNVSYGWLLLASMASVVAGPNYSEMRVYVCNANIISCALAGTVLAVIQKPRFLFALAGGWVAFGWAFFRAISFAV